MFHKVNESNKRHENAKALEGALMFHRVLIPFGVMAVCIVYVAAVSWRVVAAQCLVDLLLGPLAQVSDHPYLRSISRGIEEIKKKKKKTFCVSVSVMVVVASGNPFGFCYICFEENTNQCSKKLKGVRSFLSNLIPN
ncbi:hypothetical protein HKD37_19G054992 [Glycine soja]